MSEPEPVRAPYPPDLEPDAVPSHELGDLTDAEVEHADQVNAAARRTCVRRVTVRQSRFTGSELGESTLTDVTFVDCRLDLVGLRFATLERVEFHDCRMSECDLQGARLTDVRFERCELREATFSGVTVKRVLLQGCDLVGARGLESLRGAQIAFDDVLANAPALAVALGLQIVD